MLAFIGAKMRQNGLRLKWETLRQIICEYHGSNQNMIDTLCNRKLGSFDEKVLNLKIRSQIL